MFKMNYIQKILIGLILITVSTSPLLLANAKINDNVVPNYSFETDDLSFWNDVKGNMIWDNTMGFGTSTASLKMNAEENLTTGYWQGYLLSDSISVSAGQYYDVFLSAASDNNAIVSGDLLWSNNDTTLLFVHTSSSFAILDETYQAPAGCTSVKFYFHCGDLNSFSYHIDHIIFDDPSVVPEFEPTIMISILGLFTVVMLLVKQRK